MALTDATKEAAAIAISQLGNWVSLHTGDPVKTGANEATGGNPAYARLQTTWANGAVDGIVSGSSVTFDLPAGTYGFFGIWSAASGGTFIGGGSISPSITISTQGRIAFAPTVTMP